MVGSVGNSRLGDSHLSPQDPNSRIGGNGFVRGENCEVFLQCGGNDEAIKGSL